MPRDGAAEGIKPTACFAQTYARRNNFNEEKWGTTENALNMCLSAAILLHSPTFHLTPLRNLSVDAGFPFASGDLPRTATLFYVVQPLVLPFLGIGFDACASPRYSWKIFATFPKGS